MPAETPQGSALTQLLQTAPHVPAACGPQSFLPLLSFHSPAHASRLCSTTYGPTPANSALRGLNLGSSAVLSSLFPAPSFTIAQQPFMLYFLAPQRSQCCGGDSKCKVHRSLCQQCSAVSSNLNVLLSVMVFELHKEPKSAQRTGKGIFLSCQ